MTRPPQLLRATAPVVAVTLAAAVLLALQPHLAPAYLAALLLVATLPLGAAFVMLTWRLTGGHWADAATPACAPLLRFTWLLIPLTLPLLAAPPFGPLARDTPTTPWMSTPALLIRLALALAAWTIIAHALTRTSRRAATWWSGPALIVLLMTVAFAAIDWLLPLTPHVTSSIFGLIIAGTAFTNALAAALFVSARRGNHPHTPSPVRDLASILLTALILEAYLHLSQFLIVWNGDLPHRAAWYIPRLRGPASWLTLLLIITRLALPLPVLILSPTRRRPRLLAAAGLLILISAAPLALWLTLPSHPDATLSLAFIAVALQITFIAAFALSLRALTERGTP